MILNIPQYFVFISKIFSLKVGIFGLPVHHWTVEWQRKGDLGYVILACWGKCVPGADMLFAKQITFCREFNSV